MLETLKELCSLEGVSGAEDRVREHIVSRAGRFADDVSVDALGSVVAFKKGKKAPSKKLMLCAHMDEVGLIVTDALDDGCLKFACVGSIDRRVLPGKAVLIGERRVFGIIGSKAVHLSRKDERDRVPPVDEMYIDIGARDKKHALELVSLGDAVAFDSGFAALQNGLVKARALDDRVGCAVLLKLLESDLPVDCTFVFTAQEEVGMRGAAAAAFRVRPDIALIIEGTTAADLPSVEDGKKVCRIGRGAVIPFMDGSTIYSRELYSLLTSIAEKNGVPWQTKTYVSGGTDAAAVQRSGEGVLTAGIAAPVRNLHSPSCVACLSDIESVLRLAGLFLEEIGARC